MKAKLKCLAAASVILSASVIQGGIAAAQSSKTKSYYCIANNKQQKAIYYTKVFQVEADSGYIDTKTSAVTLAWQSFAFAHMKVDAQSPYCSWGNDNGDAATNRDSLISQMKGGSEYSVQSVDWAYGE